MVSLLIYSISVTILIIVSLIAINCKINREDIKDKILKVASILTVIIHYSSLWVDYLTNGSASVDNTMLFPIYPCNICMWLLLVYAFKKDKTSFIYKSMGEFLAIGGTLCGMIGLYANEIFLNNPNFFDYDSLKGLLSHTVMIFGTLFILFQIYKNIRVKTIVISVSLGLGLFVIIGGIINLLFALCGLDEVNAMYMLYFPFDIEGINFITIGIIAIILSFIIGMIFEMIFVEKENRWYKNIGKREKNL